MRCNRCGNENPESNRFCGMCGASMFLAPRVGQTAPGAPAQSFPPQVPLPQTPAVTPQAPPAQISSSQTPSRVEAAETAVFALPQLVTEAAPPQAEKTVISGPSFLGLDKTPASSSFKSGSTLGLDAPAPRGARNLDYLLEDDEEPKRGSGKIILILVALALVVGLGYLRWRTGGMSWLTSQTKKAPATEQGTDSSTPSSSSPGASSSPDSAPAPASGQSASPAASGVGPETASPNANLPAAAPPAPNPSPAAGAADANAPANPVASSSRTKVAAHAQPTASKENSDADDSSAEDSDEPPAKPAVAAAPKPVLMKPTAAKPVDVVTEAEKFVYGRGVRQDCERGLKMLRPAAEHSNVKAMNSLGVLYSAGLCAPRDLPTAYRWIALALRKEPENQALKDSLSKLWSEMTQPERQLAIKLSQ